MRRPGCFPGVRKEPKNEKISSAKPTRLIIHTVRKRVLLRLGNGKDRRVSYALREMV